MPPRTIGSSHSCVSNHHNISTTGNVHAATDTNTINSNGVGTASSTVAPIALVNSDYSHQNTSSRTRDSRRFFNVPTSFVQLYNYANTSEHAWREIRGMWDACGYVDEENDNHAIADVEGCGSSCQGTRPRGSMHNNIRNNNDATSTSGTNTTPTASAIFCSLTNPEVGDGATVQGGGTKDAPTTPSWEAWLM
jgi:hypothetical protein